MSEVITIQTSELARIVSSAVEEGVRKALSIKDQRSSYTVAEVAERFGKSTKWVRKMIEEGHFETYKLNGTVTRIKARSISNL